MLSPASLADLGEMHLLRHPPKGARGGRRTVNLGDIEPHELPALIGAVRHG